MAQKRGEFLIVLGVDGSAGSAAAVQWVAERASLLDAQVAAVHVVKRIDYWDLAALQVDSTPMIKHRRAQLRGPWTEPLRAAGVRSTARLVRGDPAHEILRIADDREADLVVLGTRSHSKVLDVGLGGTAHKVTNHSRCPVLLIPPPSDRRRGPPLDPKLVRPLI